MSELVINIEKLREENITNVKVSREDEHIYYIDGIPYQSKEIKEIVFNTKFNIPNVPKYLRERVIVDNILPEEKERMALMAKMVDKVYQRRKAYTRPISVSRLRGAGDETEDYTTKLEKRKLYADVDNQDVDDYILQDTGNDLSALFVNKDKKESVLAIRGLLPFTDYKDTLQLFQMAAYTIAETERAEGMGKEYKNDKLLLKNTFEESKNKYPNHKMVVTGHSRGGRLTLNLGRNNNVEYHAFSPAGNRADFIDSIPRSKGKLYYHTNDPVSLFHHRNKGKNEEQHIEMFNTRLNTHDLKDFYKNENSRFFKHASRPNQQEIEDEILLDMQLADDEIPTAEEMVDADLGRFDVIYTERLPSRKPTIVPLDEPLPQVYFDSEDTKKIKRTKALNRDVPSERTIFNKYEPSVFTDLNLRPVKKFEPITFENIDSDKNNKISKKELSNYLLKRGYDEDTIRDLFETYDTDNDGNITRSEFTNLKLML